MKRSHLLRIHRWLGLVGTAWFLLVGITGTMIAFKPELDAGLNVDLFVSRSADSHKSGLDAAAKAAGANFPGYKIRSLSGPDGVRDTIMITLAPYSGAGATLQAFYDPSTARIVGERQADCAGLSRRCLMPFLYSLHKSLYLGRVGELISVALAFAWLINHAVAFKLAIPLLRRWRESFKPRFGSDIHRTAFSFHRAFGLWLFPVTLSLIVTGIYLNWRAPSVAAIKAVATVVPRYDESAPVLKMPVPQPHIEYDAAIAVSRTVAGRLALDDILYMPDKALYWVRFHDPRDPGIYGQRWVYVDAQTFRVVADTHQRALGAGNAIMAWQFPIHSGMAFGITGRVLIGLTGLLLCFMVATGLTLWWKKRQRQKR